MLGARFKNFIAVKTFMDTQSIRFIWLVVALPSSPDDTTEDLVYSGYLDQLAARDAIVALERLQVGKPCPIKYELLVFHVGKIPDPKRS